MTSLLRTLINVLKYYGKTSMGKVMQWLGFAPSPEERKILDRLNRKESASMKVVGRGTLTMNAREARSTRKARKFVKTMDQIVD